MTPIIHALILYYKLLCLIPAGPDVAEHCRWVCVRVCLLQSVLLITSCSQRLPSPCACRTNLHKHFAYQLGLQRHNTPDSTVASNGKTQTVQPASGARPALSDSPATLALLQCQDDGDSYNVSHVGDALRAAFHRTDQELTGTEAGDYVGATAGACCGFALPCGFSAMLTDPAINLLCGFLQLSPWWAKRTSGWRTAVS